MSRTRALLAFLALACADPAAAQVIYPADLLRDLPSGGNLFAVLETAQPEITTDRFNSGGLNAGTPERISAFLASWSQTQFRVGDVTISSPVDGTPMLFPELAWWSHVDAAAALMPADSTATGLAVSLVPKPPTGRWGATMEVTGSVGGLAQRSSTARPPAIATLDHASQVTLFGHGRALDGRLRIMLGGSRTQASTIERGQPTRHSENTASVFANSVFAISNDRTLRALAWVQGNAQHWQASWEQGRRWRVFGGYTARSTTSERPSTGRIAVDRLVDGPIPRRVERGGDEHRWVAGARVSPLTRGRHAITIDGDVERTSYAAAPSFTGVVEERVDGIPARLWRYSDAGIASHRHATLINGVVRDRIALSPHVIADASLRFSSADAHADGSSGGISWRTWLPSVHLHWDLRTPLQLRLMTGVSRSADHPMLGLLAYGDPAAPTAQVFSLAPVPGAPLLARIGPGTGGDPAFSAIEPGLQRPITDQFALGLESKPHRTLRLNVTGLARRQSSLISVVNVGVPLSGYTMFTIPDANADLVGASDDQQLPVYNRNFDTFGRDRYLLTNPDVEAATMGAVVVTAEVSTSRVLFRFGGTASASVGSGGNRGFTAVENDQAIAGELFTNPNAATYARGRLFNDRAYTIKTLTVVRLPANIRAGVIARYQDGQPFSRLVVVPGLNQGAEAIQAFANGRSRFSYRATLDARLQKQFTAGRARLELIADAYNLLNSSTEVEEYVVTGPRFRETTAVQPPRSFHLGARITF
jgi:hypothetical protein